MSLSSALNLAGMALRPAAAGALHWGAAAATSALRTVQQRGLLWSVEREKGHVYKNPDDIINDKEINAALDKTKKAAKDPSAIKQILQAAKDRSFLTNFTPGALRRDTHAATNWCTPQPFAHIIRCSDLLCASHKYSTINPPSIR
jgi:hypothetical protein